MKSEKLKKTIVLILNFTLLALPEVDKWFL
jgi:hypothetical protein